MNLTSKYKAGRITLSGSSGDLVLSLMPFFQGPPGSGGGSGSGGVSNPNVGSFPNLTDQDLETEVESDPVIVTGESDMTWGARATGGELSIDGSTWHPWAVVVPGDAIRLRQTTSSQLSTPTIARLHLPGGPYDWTVTTTDTATFAPNQIAGLIGWYTAKISGTLSLAGDNEVLAIANRITGGLGGSAIAGGGPYYEESNAIANGHPALVWPDSATNRGLAIPADAPASHVFIVCAYRDGIDDTFDGYTGLITDLAGISGSSVNRAVGRTSADFLHAGASEYNKVSVNGGPHTNVVLPLPLSVLHFSAAELGMGAIPVASFGASSSVNSWRGPICEILAWSDQTPLTAPQIAQVESYLYQEWSI